MIFFPFMTALAELLRYGLIRFVGTDRLAVFGRDRFYP
jgi:hypothetical protein